MHADAEELLLTLEQKADPAHAALVLVDVQNDFLADGGFFHQAGVDVAPMREALAPLPRLLEQARQAGLLVVFVQAIYDAEYLSGAMLERNRRRGLEIPRCLTGSWGADFWTVRPQADEPIVIKHRYSAFANTALHALLQQRGVRSLLLTGATTDVCVESTARDGYFLDYYVTMVADCCAAATARWHQDALEGCARDFGTVANAAEIVAAWERLGALPGPTLTAARSDA
jgi:ureidoacrylate peracid hydrolase